MHVLVRRPLFAATSCLASRPATPLILVEADVGLWPVATKIHVPQYVGNLGIPGRKYRIVRWPDFRLSHFAISTCTSQTRQWRVIALRQADGASIDQSGEIRVLPFLESGGYRVFIGRIFAARDMFDGEDDA